VNGHQHHAVGLGVVAVQIGVQSDFLQKAGQCRLLALLLVAEHVGFEFLNVLQPGGSGVVILAQRRQITALLQEPVQKIGQGQAFRLPGEL
jgi:hypothetical protein